MSLSQSRALATQLSPSYVLVLPQADQSGLDGFLVKPLSGDILISLVQSALARQMVWPVGER